jgi:hypothetical protein
MSGDPRDLWVQQGADLRYPASCPACGVEGDFGTLEIRDGIHGSIWSRWPHCVRCVVSVRRRARAVKILGWSLLAGFAGFGVAVALQFMNTGILDNTILGAGLVWLVGVSAGSGAVVAGWLTLRGGWKKPVGVKFKRAYWGTDDLIPLDDTPVFIRYRFSSASYRNELIGLNPGACDVDLDSMKTREKAERALVSLQTPEEASATAALRQRLQDEYGSPWDTSFYGPLLMAIGSGFMLVRLATGKVRKPAEDHVVALAIAASVVFLAAAGTLLRIELARRWMALLTLAGALVMTAVAAAHWIGFNRIASPWKLAFIAAMLWYTALSLDSPAARRLCSRWGRFFARRPTP